MLDVLLLAIASLSSSGVYWQRDSWAVFERDKSCVAVNEYGRDTRLWIAYVYGLDSARVIVTDRAFQSADESKRYSLQLSFVKGSRLDDDWGTVTAEGVRLDDVGGVALDLDASDFLRDAEAATILALSLNDNVISSSLLKGSGAALAALRTCSKKVHERNPSDPLAGAELPSSSRK